jgi:hypothetical protein
MLFTKSQVEKVFYQDCNRKKYLVTDTDILVASYFSASTVNLQKVKPIFKLQYRYFQQEAFYNNDSTRI